MCLSMYVYCLCGILFYHMIPGSENKYDCLKSAPQRYGVNVLSLKLAPFKIPNNPLIIVCIYVALP